MGAVARRVPFKYLALLSFILAPSLAIQAEPANLLVGYSFDDDNVATGPDTFAVFEAAAGNVELSSAFRYSGYRSVEIRDTAGDGDFPELQGYFPQRESGTLYLHFALLTADPYETFNIALAGPEWFSLRKDGIGFRLQSRDGFLYHYSDSIPKKLMPLRSFSWDLVDVVYDVEAGTYDLTIHEEGASEPLVMLPGQKNATNQPGSVVDKFSFIGDAGSDTSNAVYYVDDVLLSVDTPIDLPPYMAPGRRRLFVDAWNDYQRLMRAQPGCLPATDLADFGIRTGGYDARHDKRLMNRLRSILHDPQPRVDWAANTTEAGKIVEAVATWVEGCAALRSDRANHALEAFDQAAEDFPGGRIYHLSSVLALARLGRWEEVDFRLSVIRALFLDDPRFAIASAAVGLMREDLDQARDWLSRPAEQLADDMSDAAIRRLWAGDADTDHLKALRNRSSLQARRRISEALIAEQYFLVLLWQGFYRQAEDYSNRVTERLRLLGIPESRWVERAGDAAFFLADHTTALRYYETALRDRPSDSLLLVKLSDVHFLLGDLQAERTYRERVYGSLEGKVQR